MSRHLLCSHSGDISLGDIEVSWSSPLLPCRPCLTPPLRVSPASSLLSPGTFPRGALLQRSLQPQARQISWLRPQTPALLGESGPVFTVLGPSYGVFSGGHGATQDGKSKDVVCAGERACPTDSQDAPCFIGNKEECGHRRTQSPEAVARAPGCGEGPLGCC